MMPSPRTLALAALLVACGRKVASEESPLGQRAPESDAVCPSERPLAFLPRDLDAAKARGCALAWKMGKDGVERSAVCCPRQ